jgi:hypothetical protein
VFACLNAGVVGSNPTRGMEVCIVSVYSVFVLAGARTCELRAIVTPFTKYSNLTYLRS